MSTYARINEYGFIETPYRRVDPETLQVTHEIDYLTADEEDNYVIAQANAAVDETGNLIDDQVIVRYKEETLLLPPRPCRLHGRFAEASGFGCDRMYPVP